MRIELFKAESNDASNLLLLDTFLLTDLKFQQDYEAKQLKAQQVKEAKKEAKDKAKKKKDEDKKEDGDDKKDDKKEEPVEINEEELPAIPTPKIKVSIELSRSGYMQVTKATAGNAPIDVQTVRKDVQLNGDQLAGARQRLNWYKRRDENKIKTDAARNAFESRIYSLRSWLREEENEPYVEESKREALIEYLNEQEDWLYEDGAQQNHTVYETLEKNLTKTATKFEERKSEHETREKVKSVVDEGMAEYTKKLEELKETKTWITDEERKDVSDKMAEIQKWLQDQLAKQQKKKLYEDPAFNTNDVVKRMKQLKNLYTKVASKKKPKPAKAEKKAEDKAEADDNQTAAENSTEGETADL